MVCVMDETHHLRGRGRPWLRPTYTNTHTRTHTHGHTHTHTHTQMSASRCTQLEMHTRTTSNMWCMCKKRAHTLHTLHTLLLLKGLQTAGNELVFPILFMVVSSRFPPRFLGLFHSSNHVFHFYPQKPLVRSGPEALTRVSLGPSAGRVKAFPLFSRRERERSRLYRRPPAKGPSKIK